MLSEAQIDKLIEELDNSEGATGSYWQMLKHAEKNGFDLAVIKTSIREALRSDLRELHITMDDSEERPLVLRLRDRIRTEMSLPALDEEERSRWRWESPMPLRRYRYTGTQTLNDQPRMTTAQIDAAASFIRSKYPKAVRYIKSVRDHNAPLGYNGGPNDHLIVRQGWHFRYVADAICEVIGGTGEMNLMDAYSKIDEALVSSKL